MKKVCIVSDNVGAFEKNKCGSRLSIPRKMCKYIEDIFFYFVGFILKHFKKVLNQIFSFKAKRNYLRTFNCDIRNNPANILPDSLVFMLYQLI